MERITIASVFADGEQLSGKTITVMGWAKTIRDMKTFGFIELNDYVVKIRKALEERKDNIGLIAQQLVVYATALHKTK